MNVFKQFEESPVYKLTRKEEIEIAKETFSELLYDELEYLGDNMTVEDMVRHTKYYDKNDFQKLIEEKILTHRKVNGNLVVKKEDYIEWFAEKEKSKTLEDVRWEIEIHGY